MQHSELVLRRAAKKGDLSASVELARRYFSSSSHSHNYDVGMTYLLDPLNEGRRDAKELLVELCPLDVILRYECLWALQQAAELGSPKASEKLGIWLSLKRSSREQAAKLLNASREQLEEPSYLAGRASEPTAVKNPCCMILGRAETAIAELEVLDAAYCIAATLALSTDDPAISSVLVRLLTVAADPTEFREYLRPAQIQEALWQQHSKGDVDASLALGCAWAGFSFRMLGAEALVSRTNHRKAVACLLRAAEGGRSDAWLKLYALTANYKSAAANQDLALYCLERAAHCRVPEAQRQHAFIRLATVRSVVEAEPLVEMLTESAQSGDSIAQQLLHTFHLPTSLTQQERVERFAQALKESHPELSARVGIAHRFGLTVEEALSPMKTAFRHWGLVLPATASMSGRAIPAVGEHMRSALSKSAVAFARFSTTQDLLARREKAELLRLMEEGGVQQDEVFARLPSSSLKCYSFGPLWAARVRDELRLNSRGSTRKAAVP